MIFKGIVTAAAAVALSATPALAQSAAPQTEVVSGTQMSEDGDGSGIVVLIGAIVLVGLGIWAIVGGDDDEAVSP